MSTQVKERIALLDIVRGLAVLGILIMNIRLFSEPSAAYLNPMVYSAHEGANKLWWAIQYFLADQKFMAIFSMLFGASTAIICDGLVRKGMPVELTFAKRIFGLLLMGLAHAYLLWSGDILVFYALGAIAPFLFRNVRWWITALAGLTLLAAGSLWSLMGYHSFDGLPPDVLEQLSAHMWLPPADHLQHEVEAFQGGWLTQQPVRAGHSWYFHTDVFLNWGVWRVTGTMLIGLALYRAGFLRGALSAKQYGLIAATAFPIGFALVAIGYMNNEAAGWAFPYSMFAGSQWNYWGSLFVAMGYMATIAVLLTATQFRFGFTALTNVGKAALSNYLFQTVMCTSIFFGHGLGLFGQLERWQTAFVVLAVWATQLALSALWFRYKSQGPLEALWHRFTYARWL